MKLSSSKYLEPVQIIIVFGLTFANALQLTVLHTNDLHSRFDEVTSTGSECNPKPQSNKKCFGGVARLKHVVDQIKQQDENVIFLNAGDFFQGTVWYSMFKWSIVANLTSSLGYTASSLGNHEFDDGVSDLEDFTNAIKDSYPMLACNLDLSQVPRLQPLIKPYILKKISGHTIAIVGYVTPDTKELADSGKVKFIDEIDSLKQTVTKLKKDHGIKIIIAVGHSGYTKDLEIAQKVDDLDIIIGGHTNTFLWSGKKPKYIKHAIIGDYPTVIGGKSKTLVVQTNGYGRYLGKLKVTFDSSGQISAYEGNPILLNNTYAKDPTLQESVLNYKNRVSAKMDTVIGSTLAFIDGSRPKCRLEECSFGNFATDAMKTEMNVEIALCNSGGIRGSLQPNGNITLHDIFTAMPWSNTIDVVTITGETLKSVLEHAVSEYDVNNPDPGGRFLQVSGLILTYDVRKSIGHRLLTAYSGSPNDRSSWKPIENDQLYEVAMPSYLANGGDRYQMIPDFRKEYKNIGLLDNDLLVDYLKKNDPLELPDPHRITVITSSSEAENSIGFGNKGAEVSISTFLIIFTFDCILFMILPLSLV